MAADKKIAIIGQLNRLDERVRIILIGDKDPTKVDVESLRLTRDMLENAHTEVFGARPPKEKVADRETWDRALARDATRLSRAQVMLTRDGTLAVPSGKTKNEGVLGPRGLTVVGKSDVKLFGEDFTPGQAKGLVTILKHRWDATMICDGLREHGYTFVMLENGLKEIKDPPVIVMTPHERKRAEFIETTKKMVNNAVLDGDVDADKAPAMIAKQIARWDASNPAPAATPPAAEVPAATPHAAETPAATPPVAETPAATPPVAETPAATPPVAETPAATPPVAETPAAAKPPAAASRRRAQN